MEKDYYSILDKLITTKYEVVLRIYYEGTIARYNVLNYNKETNILSYILEKDNYNDFLYNYIYKFLVDKSSYNKNRYKIEELSKCFKRENKYVFDDLLNIDGLYLYKTFTIFKEEDNYFLFLEDFTKQKLESFLNTVNLLDNNSIIYEIKKDKKRYHYICSSKSISSLVKIKEDELDFKLSNNHPFDFIDDSYLNDICDKLCGNEKDGFKLSLYFKIKTSYVSNIDVKATIIYLQFGKKLYAYIQFEDISDMLLNKKLKEKIDDALILNQNLNKENKTDSLTGLGNETKYGIIKKEIEDLIALNNASFGIIVLDVNGVKATNDKYGHHFGCHMIVTTGKILPSYFKSSELFHIGGDEFVIIVRGEDYDNIDIICKRISNVLEYQYMEFENVKLHLSVALGYSKYKKGDTYQDVFQRADDNMYRNKLQIKKEHNIALR